MNDAIYSNITCFRIYDAFQVMCEIFVSLFMYDRKFYIILQYVKFYSFGIINLSGKYVNHTTGHKMRKFLLKRA